MPELNIDDNKGEKYKIGAIYDNVVYAKELESGNLSGFYYLLF